MTQRQTYLAGRFPSLAPALVGVMIICGCQDGPGREIEEPTLEVRELVSPAEGESGMPFLSATDDGAILSWLGRVSESEWALRIVELDRTGVAEPVREVTRSDRFFVNWADFPSVTAFAPGAWAAHWLQRGPSGGYDYGIRVATTSDGGTTWSDPWTPHEDGTPTEHGFVSVLPIDGGYSLLWLDGRSFTSDEETAHEMQLRSRTGGPVGPLGPERLLDSRICDCCQTDVARTASGAIAVYRDRSEGEVRDIGTALYTPASGWETGDLVHADGWVIGGCPVNGPAVAASDDDVAAAWFTAAGDTARVRVAFSSDGGRTFRSPIRIDQGTPLGRVDVAMVRGGEAWVTWMERGGNEASALMIQRVAPSGPVGEPVAVARNAAARSSGFPRMVRISDQSVLVAWTDSTEPASRVRLVLIEQTTP